MKRAAGPGARALQLVLALSWLIAARAAASGLAIDWTAPLGCPTRAELASRVAQLMGGAVQSDVIAAAEVTRTTHGYRALVRIANAVGTGERVLESPRCDVLMESVALVLALSTLEPEQSHEDEQTFAVSAHAAALLGPLPKPALGAGAAVTLEVRRSFRLELHATYYPGQSATFERDETLGADFRLYRFAARACRLFSVGAFELGPCLGADIGHVRANAFGGVANYAPRATWWGPAASLFGRVNFTDSFSFYLTVEGVVPMPRRAFAFSDVGDLYRPWPVALQLSVAPEVRF